MLIVISGPSGSGKNTIINEIIKRKPYVKVMKTCTTRPPRNSEDNGYYFLTEEEFNKKKENNEFFEVEQVHKGIYYGTLKSIIEEMKQNDQIFMKDIDVNGAMKLRDELKDNVKLVFLDNEKDVLFDRILKRGETEESARLRLSRFDYERSFINEYDMVIVNHDKEDTVNKIINYFKI